MKPPAAIPCVDCDGTLHLLSLLPPEEHFTVGGPGALPQFEPGLVIAYRCDSCMERFDLVWEEPST